MKRKSSAQLRQDLRGEQYFMLHTFLATLMARGEKIDAEQEIVLNLMRSDFYDKRRFGWYCLRLAYPELAQQIGEFNPQASTEACRSQVDALHPAL